MYLYLATVVYWDGDMARETRAFHHLEQALDWAKTWGTVETVIIQAIERDRDDYDKCLDFATISTD